MSTQIRALLAQIDEAYDHQSWHGTNLKGSLRGVTPRQAVWRSGPRRHNIWKIATHAAYWKYVAWRRLTAAKRGSFALSGSDWFPSPTSTRAPDWRGSKALLDAEHARLRAALARLSGSQVSRRPVGSQLTWAALIRGIAAHDLYHAFQIQLLKRLQRGRKRAG